MDWNAFITGLLTSIGGTIGVSIIILRILKKRVETYVDATIKYGFDKKIEEYKQDLKKQFSTYESFVKKYSDCIDIIIGQLNETEKYLKQIQKCIDKCLNEQRTLEFVFKQYDDENSIIGLRNVSQALEQNRVTYQFLLQENIPDEIEVILSLIKNYAAEINQQMENLEIDRTLCQRLLDSGKAIHNKVDILLDLIKEEYNRQSGQS